MEKEQEKYLPVIHLIQVTHAGNVVVLDPVTLKEEFLVANKTYDRFTNSKGVEVTAEEIVAYTNQRLEQRAAMEEKKGESVAEAEPKRAFCSYCGARLIEGNRFCTECGKKID